MLKKYYTPLTIALLLGSMWLTTCRQPTTNRDQNGVNHRKSPIAIAAIEHMDTYIKVVYGQPGTRGRDVFGTLVPYGKIWRTGANEATEITFTRPVVFGGTYVNAGTYALFTIPDTSRWTIILNEDLGQWGAFNYQPENDITRIQRKPEKLDNKVETFTISFPDSISGNQTHMHLLWDRTGVHIPITFKPDKKS